MKRCIPIIIIVCALLAGCGSARGIYANFRAIEQLRLIQTLGLDRAGARITLSAATGAEEDAPPLILRQSGATLPAAMDALQAHSVGGTLYFAHTQYVLLGEDFARAGVRSLLDFVERDVQMRLGTELFVLRDDSAQTLITGSASGEGDIAEMLGSVSRDLSLRGDSHVYRFRETAKALSERGAALVCALRAEKTDGGVFPEGEQSALAAVPCGYGILRGDRLAGWAEGDTAAAISLLRGTLGRLPRSVTDSDGGAVTLEYGGSAALHPTWNADGTPGPMQVELSLTAAIAELGADAQSRVTDGSCAEALSAALAEAVAADVRDALALAQALDADFLALGPALRRSSGEGFAALPPDWLQTMRFDVQADCKITHSYDLGAPVQTEGQVRS